MENAATKQMSMWQGKFGKSYTDRNRCTVKTYDDYCIDMYGITGTSMIKGFLYPVKNGIRTVLEVGCNIGTQLAKLQSMGFENLYGIDCQVYAVEKAKNSTAGINIIKGSALDIPFKDRYFDLVFTRGLLIHIAPKDIRRVIKEIHRCAGKYIWGLEYYSDKYTNVDYRKHKSLLWKTDFCELYLDSFGDLKKIKEKKYKYIADNNIDQMFLLKKKNKKAP